MKKLSTQLITGRCSAVLTPKSMLFKHCLNGLSLKAECSISFQRCLLLQSLSDFKNTNAQICTLTSHTISGQTTESTQACFLICKSEMVIPYKIDVGNKRDNVYKVISTSTGRVHLSMLSTIFIIPQVITELSSTVDWPNPFCGFSRPEIKSPVQVCYCWKNTFLSFSWLSWERGPNTIPTICFSP